MTQEEFATLAAQTAANRATLIEANAALITAQAAYQRAAHHAVACQVAYTDSRNALESAANHATFAPQTALEIAAEHGIALGHAAADQDAINRGES
mgnify:CR=1 FL=1